MHAARKYSPHSPRQSESHDYDFRKRAYDDKDDEVHRNVQTVDFEKRKPRRPEPVAADRVERTHARNNHTHQRDKEKRDVNDYHIHHARRAVHCDEQADVFAEIVSVHGKNDKPRHRESGAPAPSSSTPYPASTIKEVVKNTFTEPNSISARDILSNSPPAESMVMKMPITMPSAKRAQKLITLLRLSLQKSLIMPSAERRPVDFIQHLMPAAAPVCPCLTPFAIMGEIRRKNIKNRQPQSVTLAL